MGSISILLADDSITIQKVVGIIFGSGEYSLTVVDNGTAALEKAKEIKPDILLIDALMPGMSGYEVCEAIRKDPELASKPILLMTGSFEAFDAERARVCGANDHIVKPFESQAIVAKVHELLDQAQQVASSSDYQGDAPAFAEIPAATEETFVFEQTAFETIAADENVTAAEETIVEDHSFNFAPDELQASPVDQTVSVSVDPARNLDDPWGAFTTPEAVVEEPVQSVFTPSFVEDSVQAVAESDLAVKETSVDPVGQDQHIGASWVPVEEQTFEFREEAVSSPATDLVQPAEMSLPEQEHVFSTDAFEALPVMQPVTEELAQPPQSVVPVAPDDLPTSSVISPALTEEQLLQAVKAASKETIERIVWEVVPDLAETMIREAIKRITDGK